jgi:hypothetical protein
MKRVRRLFQRLHILAIALPLAACVPATSADDTFDLRAAPRAHTWQPIESVDAEAECFSVDLRVDPVIAEGGDVQVVAGFAIGVEDGFFPAEGLGPDRERAALTVGVREGSGRSAWLLWHRGNELTSFYPDPIPPGYRTDPHYQHANVRLITDDVSYQVRLVVWPDGDGSRVRLFIGSLDRPVEEHRFDKRVRAGRVVLVTSRGGQPGDPTRTSRFSNVRFIPLSVEQARRLPSHWETILAAIDRDHHAMQPVIEAADADRIDEARRLFIDHMRTRTEPPGPTWEHVSDRQLASNWQEVADEVLAGRYGTLGFSAKFAESWTDTTGQTHRWVTQEEPLQINWERENGHLNRHFHWVALAKAWDESGDARYAERAAAEVIDWVTREPFFWAHCPTVGGVWLMDGTVFRRGFMNTSNIGRRLELTWWPTFETLRHSDAFSDEALLAMLVGTIRQAELIMNPTSFAVHDDGGAHTTLALLQTSLLLTEFKASRRWEALALDRWDQIVERQFHPDGSHVSLSTGYNWATILTLENFIRLYEQLGRIPPKKSFDILERALEHPIAVSTPSQTQVALNDGGWGMVDDHYRRTLHWFPHRDDFRWMATRGAEGTPPETTSRYLPNAGQYTMRTGWGANAKFLFFGAGPWGASHGKQDALNIYAQFGNHLLIRDAGRGSYSGVGNTVHAGRSLSYNTLSPDWAQENSIPHWRHEMHIGFHPPNRRWVSDERFEYGEGRFNYGWHRAGEHIRGTWLRQVFFVKGDDPQRDGYYVVIDTVVPEDPTERTWRHPWQLQPDAIEVREDKTTVAKGQGMAMQILPVDPVGDLNVSTIRGQEQPELLGWRIYDTTAKNWPVPTYEWSVSGPFSRGWVIQMQSDERDWPVASIEQLASESPGKLQFAVRRRDGGVDHFLRRFLSDKPIEWQGKTIVADVGLVSRNAAGKEIARLAIDDGPESVADIGPLNSRAAAGERR